MDFFLANKGIYILLFPQACTFPPSHTHKVITMKNKKNSTIYLKSKSKFKFLNTTLGNLKLTLLDNICCQRWLITNSSLSNEFFQHMYILELSKSWISILIMLVLYLVILIANVLTKERSNSHTWVKRYPSFLLIIILG